MFVLETWKFCLLSRLFFIFIGSKSFHDYIILEILETNENDDKNFQVFQCTREKLCILS